MSEPTKHLKEWTKNENRPVVQSSDLDDMGDISNMQNTNMFAFESGWKSAVPVVVKVAITEIVVWWAW